MEDKFVEKVEQYMKRTKTILSVVVSGFIAFSLALLPACAPSVSEDNTAANESAPKVTFDGSAYSNTGSGTFILEGTDGSRSDAGVPTLIISRNAASSSIYFEADGYEADPKTYFFIDGVLVAENNIPGKTVGILTIAFESLSEGVHTAEAVQFRGDAVDGEVVTYKSVEFSIQYEDTAAAPAA